MIEKTPYRVIPKTAAQRFIGKATIALGLFFVTLNWYLTQHAARVLTYPDELSGRLFAHVYQPFAWWWWSQRWAHGTISVRLMDGQRTQLHLYPLAPLWKQCEHYMVYPMVIVGSLVAIVAIFGARKPKPDLHGSASWATEAELKAAGLL